uniref:Uncharacterized protein n=1 Tax=Arundo donax TaxID=35708 RepID=A0A0A9ESE3_ARUDO
MNRIIISMSGICPVSCISEKTSAKGLLHNKQQIFRNREENM